MRHKALRLIVGLIFTALFSLMGCSTSGMKTDGGSSYSGSSYGGSVSSLEAHRMGREMPSGGPLRDVYFGFDRHSLGTEAQETLEANAEWLEENPSAKVEIEGHADERGINEYNMALGAKRAQSAKDYLVNLGVSSDRLSTNSYGEELPVCRDRTEDCWQKNRRGHSVVVSQ